MPSDFVLHLDVDSFFVQAEQLRNPELQGQAVAIQQHQDIIAANAAAKAAGVTKHMPPSEARRLLRAVNGTVAHVHLAPGGRVSYQPYRELSARMIKVLRGLPWVTVLEKASIDEAYLCVPAACDGHSFQAATLHPGPSSHSSTAPQVALQRAREAKAAVQQQLGLCVSVGVAPNRLLAKLASAAAKPDGVLLVGDQQAALRLLSETPASRLPGYGGKTADAFERHGIRAASDLQRYSQQELEQLLGLKAASAAQLAQWCQGVDSTPVQERGPPKTLSVQMSLSPQLLRMHPSLSEAMPIGGGRVGVLQPLMVGQPDFRPRIRQLMEAMGLDLLQRVREDSAEAGRWPRTLTVSVRAFGGGRDQAFTARSAAFPACTLDQQPRRQQLQVEHPQQQDEQQQQQQLGPLEQAVVRGLEAAAHQAAAAYPASATVVELRLAATSFESAAAAAAAAPITRFFSPAKPARQREVQQQAQHGAQPQAQQAMQAGSAQQQQRHQGAASGAGLDAEQRGDGQAPCSSREASEPADSCQLASHAAEPLTQLPESTRQVVAHSSSSESRKEERSEDGEVDLGSVDVKEQQRILFDCQRQQGAQQQPTRSSGSRLGLASSKRQRKQGCPAAAGATQPKISAFLRRQQ